MIPPPGSMPTPDHRPESSLPPPERRPLSGPQLVTLLAIMAAGGVMRVLTLLHALRSPGYVWEDPDSYLAQGLRLAGPDGWAWTFDAVTYTINGQRHALPPMYSIFLSLFALLPGFPLTAQIAQCLHPTLVADVARVLAETGLEPNRLKLEITESLVLQGSGEMIAILKALRELGVQLGLDDFGMGYPALSYLQQLPVQTLKIDRSFVNGIQNTSNSEIVRAILSLASGLSMNVTAEGVETADQAARLRDLSCEFAQGYFFDRPLTPDRARDVLRKHQRSMSLS